MANEKDAAGKSTVIEVQGAAPLKRLEVGRGRTGTRVISAGEDGVETSASFPSRDEALRANGLVLKADQHLAVVVAVPGTPKGKKAAAKKGKKGTKKGKKAAAKKAPAKKAAAPVQQAA